MKRQALIFFAMVVLVIMIAFMSALASVSTQSQTGDITASINY